AKVHRVDAQHPPAIRRAARGVGGDRRHDHARLDLVAGVRRVVDHEQLVSPDGKLTRSDGVVVLVHRISLLSRAASRPVAAPAYPLDLSWRWALGRRARRWTPWASPTGPASSWPVAEAPWSGRSGQRARPGAAPLARCRRRLARESPAGPRPPLIA